LGQSPPQRQSSVDGSFSAFLDRGIKNCVIGELAVIVKGKGQLQDFPLKGKRLNGSTNSSFLTTRSINVMGEMGFMALPHLAGEAVFVPPDCVQRRCFCQETDGYTLRASWHCHCSSIELMKAVELRIPVVYRSRFNETVELLRNSPRIALFWIGAVGLLTAAFLMLLLVVLLQ
jgi:hypothetical protein